MLRRTAHTAFDPGFDTEQRDPAMLRVQVGRWCVPPPPPLSLSLARSLSRAPLLALKSDFPDRQMKYRARADQWG